MSRTGNRESVCNKNSMKVDKKEEERGLGRPKCGIKIQRKALRLVQRVVDKNLRPLISDQDKPGTQKWAKKYRTVIRYQPRYDTMIEYYATPVCPFLSHGSPSRIKIAPAATDQSCARCRWWRYAYSPKRRQDMVGLR